MNQPPPIPGSVQPKTSALAIVSLVLGILATMLCFVGPVFGIPAIICGHVAANRINRSGGALAGKGLAIAGFVTGYANLGFLVLMLPIIIPNFMKGRHIGQQNTCIGNLQLIDSLKQQSAIQHPENPLTKENLLRLNTNSVWPVCPAGGTYEIGTANELPTCTIPGHTLTP